MAIKVYDTENLTPDQKRAAGIFETSTLVSDASGLFNTRVMEPTYNYLRAQNEQMLGDKTVDANIVIGTDRPSQVSGPGYGSIGAQKANAIDIVVGRMAAVNKGKGPSNSTWVAPSFVADAARIYMSQMTDIDANFGLANGRQGASTGISGIGIKADAVRIIGRTGIKIITGGTMDFEGAGDGNGETNSKGGNLNPSPFIELIAGNVTEDTDGNGVKFVQGTARGENVRDCIEALRQNMWAMYGALLDFCFLQIMFNSTCQINIIPYHAAHATVGTQTNHQTLSACQGAIAELRQQLSADIPQTYLTSNAPKYVASKSVFTT